METINDIVREVAAEMLNTSMQEITAERIHGWATKLGDAATCKDSLQVGNESLTPNEMETINDIVREMREFADADSQSIGRDVLRRQIQHFADRIEAAYKREMVTDCNALQDTCKQSLQGNTAKMREALEKIKECYENDYLSLDRDPGDVLGDAALLANNALSAPLRNCDRCLTPKDAMLAHLAEVYKGEKVEFGDYEWCEFVKWLFAEAKGETK